MTLVGIGDWEWGLRLILVVGDLNSASELNNRLFGDVKKISNGIGDKLGITNQAFFQFIGGLIIGFIYGWKMALVVLGWFLKPRSKL